MNTNWTTAGIEDVKVKLSTFWVFVMFNMLAADILIFEYPGFLKGIMTGYAEKLRITPGLLLIAAIMMEIPIAMIFLSRVLKYLSLIHISEPTRLGMISYAVFCLKKKKKKT